MTGKADLKGWLWGVGWLIAVVLLGYGGDIQGSTGSQRTIADFLKGTRIGDPITFRNMSVFPVTVEGGRRQSYAILEEALKEGVIEVVEKDVGGRVPELLVRNRSDRKVLLLEGEELIGAKQNRVVNTTLLVAERQEMVVPVSCVEAGRWVYTSPAFASGKASHARLRSQISKDVTSSLKRDTSYRANQSAVWGEIERKQDLMAVVSETKALHDVYVDKQADLERYLQAFGTLGGVHGIAVEINGELSGMDVFGDPETLSKLRRKLLESHALDALEEVEEHLPEPEREKMARLLQSVQEGTYEEYASVGEGTNVRISTEDLTGSALLYGGEVIHLSIFRSSQIGGERDSLR